MGPDADTGVGSEPATAGGTDRTLPVALGRRVEVIGDLLLPPEPTDSSRAACRDIAQRLEEWQGPGIVIVCGRLVAPGCPDDPTGVMDKHPDLMDALGAFASRADSQVVVVMAPSERDPALVQALERRGVAVRDGVDLACETGAGTRTVLVRAGTLRPDGNPPIDATPTDDRPWLVGMDRLDDPRSARRFVTSRVLYRRLRRYLWAPPLALAVIALLLRVEFVVDGLGRVFRTHRQQTALQRAYDATWPSRFIVTLVIALALLAVLAVVVAITSRGIWRALGGEGLPAPWAGGPPGTRPIAHAQLELDGVDALDADAGRRRGRGLGCHRRGRAGSRADPPRCRVLRLPGRHLRGRARTPGAPGTPTDVPPPPPGVDPRDRDRGGAARAPAPGRGRPAARHHG